MPPNRTCRCGGTGWDGCPPRQTIDTESALDVFRRAVIADVAGRAIFGPARLGLASAIALDVAERGREDRPRVEPIAALNPPTATNDLLDTYLKKEYGNAEPA